MCICFRERKECVMFKIGVGDRLNFKGDWLIKSVFTFFSTVP